MSTPPPSAAEQERLEAERAAIEEQLARMTSAELALQAAVSLLSLGGRRLGLAGGTEGERDLEQVRDAIDGVRGLMPVLERTMAAELGWLRDALSQLQMAYAREARAGAADAAQDPSAGTEPQQAAGDTGAAGTAPATAPPAGAGERQAGEPRAGDAQPEETPPGAQGDRSPGPAESSGRLWVPKQ